MRELKELQQLVDEANEVTGGTYDNIIKYEADQFWTMLEERELEYSTIANMIFFGSYNASHEYIGFDGYGNIESANEYDYCKELMDMEEEFLAEL